MNQARLLDKFLERPTVESTFDIDNAVERIVEFSLNSITLIVVTNNEPHKHARSINVDCHAVYKIKLLPGWKSSSPIRTCSQQRRPYWRQYHASHIFGKDLSRSYCSQTSKNEITWISLNWTSTLAMLANHLKPLTRTSVITTRWHRAREIATLILWENPTCPIDPMTLQREVTKITTSASPPWK